MPDFDNETSRTGTSHRLERVGPPRVWVNISTMRIAILCVLIISILVSANAWAAETLTYSGTAGSLASHKEFIVEFTTYRTGNIVAIASVETKKGNRYIMNVLYYDENPPPYLPNWRRVCDDFFEAPSSGITELRCEVVNAAADKWRVEVGTANGRTSVILSIMSESNP